jgi:hypothetical protein
LWEDVAVVVVVGGYYVGCGVAAVHAKIIPSAPGTPFTFVKCVDLGILLGGISLLNLPFRVEWVGFVAFVLWWFSAG